MQRRSAGGEQKGRIVRAAEGLHYTVVVVPNKELHINNVLRAISYPCRKHEPKSDRLSTHTSKQLQGGSSDVWSDVQCSVPGIY